MFATHLSAIGSGNGCGKLSKKDCKVTAANRPLLTMSGSRFTTSLAIGSSTGGAGAV